MKTKHISPLRALLGLTALLAPILYYLHRKPTAFFWLIFIGFFCNWFDAKMSGTLMDERYRENAALAELHSRRFTICAISAVLGFVAAYYNPLRGEMAFALLLGAVSFLVGFQMLLRSYLLYRYDQKG